MKYAVRSRAVIAALASCFALVAPAVTIPQAAQAEVVPDIKFVLTDMNSTVVTVRARYRVLYSEFRDLGIFVNTSPKYAAPQFFIKTNSPATLWQGGQWYPGYTGSNVKRTCTSLSVTRYPAVDGYVGIKVVFARACLRLASTSPSPQQVRTSVRQAYGCGGLNHWAPGERKYMAWVGVGGSTKTTASAEGRDAGGGC